MTCNRTPERDRIIDLSRDAVFICGIGILKTAGDTDRKIGMKLISGGLCHGAGGFFGIDAVLHNDLGRDTCRHFRLVAVGDAGTFHDGRGTLRIRDQGSDQAGSAALHRRDHQMLFDQRGGDPAILFSHILFLVGFVFCHNSILPYFAFSRETFCAPDVISNLEDGAMYKEIN